MKQWNVLVVILGLVAAGAYAQPRVIESQVSESALVGAGLDRIWPRSVTVFAAPDAPVVMDGPLALSIRERGIPITHFLVSDLVETENSLSRDLPSDPQEAAQEVARRMQSGAIDEEAIKRGWLGVVMARQMKIARIPAVVFDGNRVVYGVANVDLALAKYREYEATNFEASAR